MERKSRRTQEVDCRHLCYSPGYQLSEGGEASGRGQSDSKGTQTCRECHISGRSARNKTKIKGHFSLQRKQNWGLQVRYVLGSCELYGCSHK